jgi:hypothetical protein
MTPSTRPQSTNCSWTSTSPHWPHTNGGCTSMYIYSGTDTRQHVKTISPTSLLINLNFRLTSP